MNEFENAFALNDDDIFDNDSENITSNNLESENSAILEQDKLNNGKETQNKNQFENFNLFNDEVEETTSVMDKFLESKGFKDSKVKILDENNNENLVDFKSLSEDEQLEILNSFSYKENTKSDNNEESEEQVFLKQLKDNNLTLEQFLDLYKRDILANIEGEQISYYDIDAYDDKELYLLDIKNKFDLTDEELQAELEKELANPDIFTKKVAKIREEYKLLEEQQKLQSQKEFEETQQIEYQNFVNEVQKVAQNNSEFHGIELEQEEKNETLAYLLNLDENGTSQFFKDLNSPEKLYELAWYLKYGKDAFKMISDIYEEEIRKLKASKDKPVTIRQQSNKIPTINDLD